MPSTLLSFPYYRSNPYLTMLTVAPRAAAWDVVEGVQGPHRLAAARSTSAGWTCSTSTGLAGDCRLRGS